MAEPQNNTLICAGCQEERPADTPQFYCVDCGQYVLACCWGTGGKCALCEEAAAQSE